MTSTEFSNSALKKKFRGCMIGALIGDCLGSTFKIEGYFKEGLVDFLNGVTSGETTKIFCHTDNTKMALNIASYLAEKSEINLEDVAEQFATDYFCQKMNKGHEMLVKMVFHKLKESIYNLYFLIHFVFKPTKEQLNGRGLFGCAMEAIPNRKDRIIFGNRRDEEYAMEAAMLQCMAVNAALNFRPTQELDPVNFTDDLQKKMENIETGRIKQYSESLKKMKNFFAQNRGDASSKEVAECLGNGRDVSAPKSVTPAIYSFLKGMKPIKEYESDNPFMKTIYFAISLGGDTDTIAAMAGAIAGAYYGEDMIPDSVQKRCEGIEEIIALADKLFFVTYKDK